MSGELSVLNCGKGDIRIKLDKDNPIDIARAKRMIQDMLRRGYLLAIERSDGKLVPVESFDAEAGEYIIVEGALYSGGEDPPPVNEAEAGEKPEPKKRGRPAKTRVPMANARATAVPMTAGG